MKDVGSQATPEVIESWNEVYQLYKELEGERRERLVQVAESLGVSFKVARRRLRNYEAMNKIEPMSKGRQGRSQGKKTDAVSEVADRMIVCMDCGEQFPFTAREQAFFNEKGFQPPKRCKSCRQALKDVSPRRA